jgi:hypothetical protein
LLAEPFAYFAPVIVAAEVPRVLNVSDAADRSCGCFEQEHVASEYAFEGWPIVL